MFESAAGETPGVGATEDRAAVAGAVADCFRALVAAECTQLRLAAQWADLHLPEQPTSEAAQPGTERAREFGGPGTPQMLEFAAAEFGALQEMSRLSASRLIADALDLRHRLPRLWRRVLDGQVRAYQARWVAQNTRHLSSQAADCVDASVAEYANTLPWSRFQRLVEARVIAADPAQAEARAELEAADRFVRAGQSNEHGLKLLVAKAQAGDVIWFVAMADRIAQILLQNGDVDPVDVRRSKAIGILAQPATALKLLLAHEGRVAETDPDQQLADLVTSSDDLAARLRPVTLYVHVDRESLLSGSGVARLEDVGPVTLKQVRSFLGTNCRVTVTPVVDLENFKAVDSYEFPARLRDGLYLRNPVDVFPFGTNVTRRKDVDHTVPYRPPDRGGPPGQTRIGNGGLVARFSHRIKTHGRWRLRQPRAGSYLWRSPTGWYFLVDHNGTHSLGDDGFAAEIWAAAGRLQAAELEAYPGNPGVEIDLTRVA